MSDEPTPPDQKDEQATPASPALWIVAAWIPVLCDLPLRGCLAWAGALLVGALVTSERPLRWVAIAWAAAVAVPTTSLFGIAVTGSMTRSWAHQVLAAGLGVVLVLFLPYGLRNVGFLLFVTSLAVIVSGRRS